MLERLRLLNLVLSGAVSVAALVGTAGAPLLRSRARSLSTTPVCSRKA